MVLASQEKGIIQDLPDPNIAQHQAADPFASVWVSASAGTGKTKVLTDRLLRLMLPAEEREATPAHKILCLTFTKTGAAEMKERITDVLSEWAVFSDPQLFEALEKLLGVKPSDEQCMAARSLFAEVVDTSGGLQIMTIHAFCQSVLGRFPLEAGLIPGTEVLDEIGTQKIIRQAFNSVMHYFRQEEQALSESLDRLLKTQTEKDLLYYAQSCVSKKVELQHLVDRYQGFAGLSDEIFKMLSVKPEDTPEIYWQEFFEARNRRNFSMLLNALDQGTSANKILGERIFQALKNDDKGVWQDIFLTKEGAHRKLHKSFADKNLEAAEIYGAEAKHILRTLDKVKALKSAQLTSDLLLFGYAMVQAFEKRKAQQNVLDFDDLIFYTAKLLDPQMRAGALDWVMYKLDGGVDHILLDEAQDTSPDQWKIVKGLAYEFFSGDSAREDLIRTLFVVGDEKQSIFSFQGADPKVFAEMKRYFDDQITAAQQRFDPVEMNVSFRTVQGILDSVDHVFEAEKMHKQIAESAQEPVQHFSFRRGQASHIELWPLFSTDRSRNNQAWAPPTEVKEKSKASPALAKHLAETIAGWLEEQKFLPSRGRIIKPSDVMILVRSRTSFVNQLMRQLKSKGVPVTGADRMVVSKEICIQDIMAAAAFGLLPEDDLTLASLLKSPFVGLSEEQLFDLSYSRKGSLWQALKDSAHEKAVQWCERLIEVTATKMPLSFLYHVLYKPCPASEASGLFALTQRLGQDVIDPIEELLSIAQHHEIDETASLQGFLSHMREQDSPIKREMENSADMVQIMTAHGSKGLQAPIVILADTTRSKNQARKNIDRLLWPSRSNLPVPLWAPYKELEPSLYSDVRERLGTEEDAEYRRLLYVAMTRAEDALYLCGIDGHHRPIEESWYFDVKHALSQMEGVKAEPFEAEEGVLLESNERFVLSLEQIAKPDRITKDKETLEVQRNSLPSWVHDPAPIEQDPPRPLMPSRPSEEEPEAMSPLGQDDNQRFKRGNLTHSLLQFLPDMDPKAREEAARRYLKQPAHNISEAMQASIIKEIMAIFTNPRFEQLFGSESMAEVPIAGLLQNKALSGQIDRLCVTDDEIMIIDYKTNRPSPTDIIAIPSIYKKQMQSYADALKEIYPAQRVSAYLLWTDVPSLMEVPIT